MQEIQLLEGSMKEQLLKLPEQQLQQIVAQANQWHDYSKYTGMMHGIAKEMKEIPEIPSEVVKENNVLLKVEFPESGGVLTYMEGFDHPYRGYPHYEFVDKIDSIKKTSRAFISGIYHQIKDKKLWIITLLPGMWFIKDLIRSWIYVNYRLIDRFKIKEQRYCVAVKEIYRAMSLEVPGKKDGTLRNQVKDIVCMILEMDNAYRFRAQDILSEMNQDEMKKHPAKELSRLLSLLQSREIGQDVKDTWKLGKYAIHFYLRFDKEVRDIISYAFSQLDLEKVKLSEFDKPYCVPRKDYVFGFMKNPSLEDKKLIEKHKLKEKNKQEESKIKSESTKVHQEMQEKHFKENEKVLSHKDGSRIVIEALQERQKKEISELDDKYNKLLTDAKLRYQNELGLL